MDTEEIKTTIQRIADRYDAKIYDVYLCDNNLVIEQDQISETKFATVSALIADQYRCKYDKVVIRSPNSDDRFSIHRSDIQKALDNIAKFIGTTEDLKN
jgi:hypothetical protein